jgi:polyisoprenoid-binding protein YceI
VARFEATSLKPLGGNRYRVDGRLTIKGRTRDVSAPFTYTADAVGGTFAGQFSIRRADFAIGEGAWRDFGLVGNDIGIRFQLRVMP